MSRPVRWLNPPRTVWPVILVALCVRLAPIPLIARLAPDVQAAGFASDGTDLYARLGHSLAASHEFALHPGHPTAGHVPIYPALLALLEIAGRPGPLAGWTCLFDLVVGEAESRYHFNLLPAVFVFAGMSLSAALLFLNPAAPQSPVRSLTG